MSRSRQQTSRIICRCKRIEFHWDKFYYTTPSRLERIYIYNWNLTPRLCVVQANIAAQNERDITEQTRLDKCEVTIVSRAAKHRTLCLELAQSIDRLFCTNFSSLSKFCKKNLKLLIPTIAWSPRNLETIIHEFFATVLHQQIIFKWSNEHISFERRRKKKEKRKSPSKQKRQWVWWRSWIIFGTHKRDSEK